MEWFSREDEHSTCQVCAREHCLCTPVGTEAVPVHEDDILALVGLESDGLSGQRTGLEVPIVHSGHICEVISTKFIAIQFLVSLVLFTVAGHCTDLPFLAGSSSCPFRLLGVVHYEQGWEPCHVNTVWVSEVREVWGSGGDEWCLPEWFSVREFQVLGDGCQSVPALVPVEFLVLYLGLDPCHRTHGIPETTLPHSFAVRYRIILAEESPTPHAESVGDAHVADQFPFSKLYRHDRQSLFSSLDSFQDLFFSNLCALISLRFNPHYHSTPATMRKGYKQPTKAQMAQIEEKKRIQQMATPPPPGTHNVVTQVYILVFQRESKRLERALLPAEFDLFVKGMDLKPSELLKEFFILPMPVMDVVLPQLMEWMSEGASGKLEKMEVPQNSGEEESEGSLASSSSALSSLSLSHSLSGDDGSVTE